MEPPRNAAMNLLFLVHNPNNPHSGAVRIYHILAEGLRERGHHVRTLYLEDYDLPRNRTANLLLQRLALPTMVSRTAGRLDLSGLDVIMSSSGMAAPLFRKLRGRAIRPVLVNHVHGLFKYDHVANMTEDQLGHWRVSKAYRLVTAPFQVRWDTGGVASADHTTVQNLRDLSEVRDMVRNHTKATIIPASVHPELSAASADITDLRSRRPCAILYFGTWEARKGSYYIPAAFRMIRQSRQDATLTIGGTGLSADVIRSQFDERDRSAVTVTPHLSNAEHVKLMNDHAIFLFPSLSEGFGLALLEALCFGLAAVTTNTGFGADYLVDGLSSKIVFPSSDHIARAVLNLIDDQDLRCAIAMNGRAVARTLTPERAISSYECLFRTLTRSRLTADQSMSAA